MQQQLRMKNFYLLHTFILFWCAYFFLLDPQLFLILQLLYAISHPAAEEYSDFASYI